MTQPNETKGARKHNWRKMKPQKTQEYDPKWQSGMCQSCAVQGFKGGLPCADPRCIKGTLDREIYVGGARYRRSRKDGKCFWQLL